MKDALALAAAAIWFALNIVLWVVVETALELFGWSVAMGTAYFAGFFGYLGYRHRTREGQLIAEERPQRGRGRYRCY